MSRLLTWKEMPIGGVIPQAGSSRAYPTGGWRTYRPVRDEAKCVHCLRCWVLCPDSAVLVEDGQVVGYDYDHCKGCGICARECPPKCGAVEMRREGEEEWSGGVVE
jgi:pyruvate ferredoxin oxidoreductase delta subunit